MNHKNDYTVIAFFSNVPPKKWNYVHKISSFSKFLDAKLPSWQYINVYERRTGKFLKRFNKESIIPEFINSK